MPGHVAIPAVPTRTVRVVAALALAFSATGCARGALAHDLARGEEATCMRTSEEAATAVADRKSTRLNSSHT